MRRTTLLAAAGFLVAAALAGCGDDDGAATTGAPGTTAAPATTGAPPATDVPVTTEESETTTLGTAPPPVTSPPETAPSETETPGMTLFVSALADGSDIPVEFTCDGANTGPEIRFDRTPVGTTSLALTVIDPDGGDWIHWIAWNIPPGSGGIPADAPAGDLPDGTRQAENDYAKGFEAGETFPGGGPIRIDGWDGPCPGGRHEYVFTLYALAGTVDLPTGTPGAEILAAIEAARADGNLIGEASVSGFYGG